MQSMLTGLGSGERIFTCATGRPVPVPAPLSIGPRSSAQRSITPLMRFPGPVCGTFWTTVVTSTTRSPFSTPRR
jgi:hypothetical protein